jgi:hypothetical protein
MYESLIGFLFAGGFIAAYTVGRRFVIGAKECKTKWTFDKNTGTSERLLPPAMTTDELSRHHGKAK